jgi:hypothetical protein
MRLGDLHKKFKLLESLYGENSEKVETYLSCSKCKYGDVRIGCICPPDIRAKYKYKLKNNKTMCLVVYEKTNQIKNV